MKITSGTLSAKIQRHEAVSTSWPPRIGPNTTPIPPQAVQAPTGLAALRLREGGHDHGQSGRREERSGHPLKRAAGHQDLDRGRHRAHDRSEPEGHDPEREHAPLAEDVAERATDQQQRAERDEVRVRGPLLARETAAEIAGYSRQRR